MKRKITLITLFSCLGLLLSFSAGVFAANKIDLIINGNNTKYEVKLIDGMAYIPVRALGELKDIKYHFNAKSQFITIYDDAPRVYTQPTAETTTPTKTTVVKKENLTTASEVKAFLEDGFSQLKTSIGDAKFNFTVDENKTTLIPYDFWIQINYDQSFFNKVSFGNDITESQRDSVKRELKEHIEKIGKAATAAAPTKKLYGNYYRSWYRYPNIQVDLITRRYYTWQNYEGSIGSDYRKSSASSFRWNDQIDDKL